MPMYLEGGGLKGCVCVCGGGTSTERDLAHGEVLVSEGYASGQRIRPGRNKLLYRNVSEKSFPLTARSAEIHHSAV